MGDMAKCPRCQTHHYRNDPCPHEPDTDRHKVLDEEINRLQSLGVTATFTGGTMATLSVSDNVQLISDMRLVLDNEEYLRQKDGRCQPN